MIVPLINIYGEDMSLKVPSRVSPITVTEQAQLDLIKGEISHLRAEINNLEHAAKRITEREPNHG